MKQLQSVPRKRVLTSALLLALAGPAWAQQAEPQGDTSAAPATTNQVDPTELDTVVVKGIRASLESSMNLKRDARGIVALGHDADQRFRARLAHQDPAARAAEIGKASRDQFLIRRYSCLPR